MGGRGGGGFFLPWVGFSGRDFLRGDFTISKITAGRHACMREMDKSNARCIVPSMSYTQSQI